MWTNGFMKWHWHCFTKNVRVSSKSGDELFFKPLITYYLVICSLEIQITFKVKALLRGYCGLTINTYVPTFRSSCLPPSFLGFFGAEDGRCMRLRNVGNFVPINLTYIPKDSNLNNTAVITSNLARWNVLYLECTGLMEWFVCFVSSLNFCVRE